MGTRNQIESRVKKTLLNARVNLIFYFLTLILSFYSRKIFLNCLGADFVGLTGTINNLLGFLNLAELGIGSAIGYVLYKPIFEKRHDKICEIISVMGYLYRWIGGIIAGGGVLLSCFLPLIFPENETGFSLLLTYFAYYSFLGSSLIGYFINYRQNLLGADQKNYVVTAYFQTTNIIKIIIQMLFAYYTGNYYIWVFIELSFGILYSFILNWKINQTYPWLKTQIKNGKRLLKQYPEVAKYVKQLFVHKISFFVQFQTTPFLIYSFVNLTTVAFYQNYMVVLDKASTLFTTFLGSSGAGVGNLIAEGDNKKIIRVFWEMFTAQIIAGSFMCYMSWLMIDPFISLWIGQEYVLGKIILILILTRLFIAMTRPVTDQFLYGYGLFYDVWAPIAETIIYVAAAIIGGHFWGLPGVLLGGVLSYLVIIWGWKPVFLFTKGFKLSIARYWIPLIGYYSIVGVSIYSTDIVLKYISIDSPATGYIEWIVYAIIAAVIFLLQMCTLLYICTPGMRMLVKRLILKRV